MKLVLASASSARAEMLKRAGVATTIDPGDVDEARIKSDCLARGESVEDAALALAEAKARAVAKRHPAALVLGADQMLECDGSWLDKPADHDQAAAQLRALSGRTHRLVSGAVALEGGRPVWQATTAASLTMRPLSEAFIRTYIDAMGSALLKSVGAYQIEGLGAQLFTKVEGDLFTIMGLPLLPLLEFLRRQGLLPA
jgi:septum formation protein